MNLVFPGISPTSPIQITGNLNLGKLRTGKASKTPIPMKMEVKVKDLLVRTFPDVADLMNLSCSRPVKMKGVMALSIDRIHPLLWVCSHQWDPEGKIWRSKFIGITLDVGEGDLAQPSILGVQEKLGDSNVSRIVNERTEIQSRLEDFRTGLEIIIFKKGPEYPSFLAASPQITLSNIRWIAGLIGAYTSPLPEVPENLLRTGAVRLDSEDFLSTLRQDFDR